MAHASRKHMGVGPTGKNDGTGTMSDIEPEEITENMALSNRDKAARSGDQRGLDSKAVQTEQQRDHTANRVIDEGADSV